MSENQRVANRALAWSVASMVVVLLCVVSIPKGVEAVRQTSGDPATRFRARFALGLALLPAALVLLAVVVAVLTST